MFFKCKGVARTGLELTLPSDDIVQEDEDDRCYINFLKRAFLPTLLESIIILSANSAAAHYLKPGTPWYKNPLLSSSAFLTTNFFTRLYRGDPINSSLTRRGLRLMRSALYSVAAITLYIWIHEGGHALTSMVLFKEANPKIQFLGGFISPQGANTQYNPNQLTPAGESLGIIHSQTMVNAMGAGAELLYNFVQLISAQVFSDNYPEIRSYLRFATLMNLMNMIVYGASGYSDCKESSNDFCNLNKAGYSPALIVSLVVASTLFLQLCLSGVKYCLNRTSTDRHEPEYTELSTVISEEENDSLTTLKISM
jgi:hypothetical protein